jgi:AcrR family transcriptional regulator
VVYHTESKFRFQVRMSTLEKPLRADARRNREKVLAAARAVFAEDGVDAQMDDVARRAGLGIGTVYRHFPTKELLLYALTDELFAVIAVHTRTLLTLDDPWEAFTRALWFAGEKTAGDRAFTEILTACAATPRAPVRARRTCSRPRPC